MKKNEIESQIIKFSRKRIITADILREGKKKHHAQGYLRADITNIKNIIRNYREKYGISLSFTAFLIKYLAQSIEKHPIMHGMMKGIFRKRITIFKDVDVSILIERKSAKGEKFPSVYIVRAAQSKTVLEIHDEIRTAQSQTGDNIMLDDQNTKNQAQLLSSLPGFIRKIVWFIMMRSPKMFKKNMGTAVISSIGMFLSDFSQFGATTVWPFGLLVGGIGKKPVVIKQLDKNEIIEKKVLGLTTLIDHIVVDGGPAARFVKDFINQIENPRDFCGHLVPNRPPIQDTKLLI
jgi:pyruvate/2-oxoglutarate dehydrogenase complex dihydrolipoamide acyltransferase (E2) component